MNQAVMETLKELKFGEAQTSGAMTVYPVFGKEGGPAYITLVEALEAKTIVIEEVGGGSVPELSARNTGSQPVLILDGEQVEGLKQNRGLNTTVLIPPLQKTILPVACFEAGRWSGHWSGEVVAVDFASPAMRHRTQQEVRLNLGRNMGYRNDQQRVWDDVACYQANTGTQSETSAYQNLQRTHRERFEEFGKAFKIQPGQMGMLVSFNGKAVALEYVSRTNAWQKVFARLLHGYILDAFSLKAEQGREAEAPPSFIFRALDCREETYKAPGLGQSYRYTSKEVEGSALVHEEASVHIALFRGGGEQPDPTGPSINGWRTRRNAMRRTGFGLDTILD
jgi:hypothetical protein